MEISKGLRIVVVGLLVLGLVGLQHAQAAAQVGGRCSTGQCVMHCIAQGHDSEQCKLACGCRDVETADVVAGCRLGCSSKCNDANKSVGSSDYIKERCKDVCYSLCAKGIDITTTATVAAA